VYWRLQNTNIALYASVRAIKSSLWGNILKSTIDGLLAPYRRFSRPSNNNLSPAVTEEKKSFRKKINTGKKKARMNRALDQSVNCFQ